MAKEYNPVISLRVPKPMVEVIDAAVATGRYRNRADYIMAALRFFEESNIRTHESQSPSELISDAPTEIAAGGGGQGNL